jgi:hypothetical protein
MPGTETTTPRLSPVQVVPSGPNRVLYAYHQPHRPTFSRTTLLRSVLTGPAVADSDWPVSPPVSTPIRHTRTAGYCTPFGVSCSLERRLSSRTFRYGYLVTTSSQSPAPPSTTPSSTLVRPWASGVADFRDVTGGVYKARERSHRRVADLR